MDRIAVYQNFSFVTQYYYAVSVMVMEKEVVLLRIYIFKLPLYFRYYCLSDNVVAGNANSALYDCPAGFYCPEGTGYDWQACPKGTYSTQIRLYQVWCKLSLHYTAQD